MKLVLDTNIFCADYRLQGNAFRILFEVANKIGAEIFVPQVVFEETIGKFQSTYQDVSLKLEKATRDTERLLGEKLSTENTKEIDKIVNDYQNFLSKKLSDNNVNLLPYPQIEHKLIVARAIKRKKPFKENGDGYRDTLIWYSLLELARGNKSTIAFVTGNSSDFGKQTLLPDLQNDLDENNISSNTISIISTLDEFNKLFAVPVLQTLEGMAEKLENDLVGNFSLKNWVQNSLLEELKWLQIEDVFVGIDQDHAELNFIEIKEVKNIIVDNVRLLPSGDFIVAATTEIIAGISVNITWEQYEKYVDVQDFWGSEDDEPFSWASTDVLKNGEVRFTLILEEDTHRILSSEIDVINSDHWGVVFNSHPEKSF
jgi:hypothetical protein